MVNTFLSPSCEHKVKSLRHSLHHSEKKKTKQNKPRSSGRQVKFSYSIEKAISHVTVLAAVPHSIFPPPSKALLYALLLHFHTVQSSTSASMKQANGNVRKYKWDFLFSSTTTATLYPKNGHSYFIFLHIFFNLSQWNTEILKTNWVTFLFTSYFILQGNRSSKIFFCPGF